MVPVLVVDCEVEHGVDVLDRHAEEPVPRGVDGLVLGVRLQPLVVQLQDHVGIALPPEVRGHQTLMKKKRARLLPYGTFANF